MLPEPGPCYHPTALAVELLWELHTAGVVLGAVVRRMGDSVAKRKWREDGGICCYTVVTVAVLREDSDLYNVGLDVSHHFHDVFTRSCLVLLNSTPGRPESRPWCQIHEADLEENHSYHTSQR
jgi:hypothetical protein